MSLAILFLSSCAVARRGGNCDVDIPRVPNAPNDHYLAMEIGDSSQAHPEPYDLDDALMDPDPESYRQLKINCRDGDGPHCYTFGIQQWNLTSYKALAMEGERGKPCAEDAAASPSSSSCRPPSICKTINGKRRLVGLEVHITRSSVDALADLPHLFALTIDGISDEEFNGIGLPRSLRVVTVLLEHVKDWKKIGKLLREQGQIQSLYIPGPYHIKEWLQIDMSELCGLDLHRFTAHTIHVAGGAIPACWSRMENLEFFYCTNCMLHTPPTSLQGLTSLKVFVAFRQFEMIPCALKDLARSKAECKPSWETRQGSKDGGVRDSSGEWDDFQEGPSFLCPEGAFAFPFEEFLDLGWTNLRKLWLDGNFLSGTIPKRIGVVWPQLQSLDLYDNRLQGPIPDSLGNLKLHKLQLQANNFSGELPNSVVEMNSIKHFTFGISENPELRGCLPKSIFREGHGTAGTQLSTCEESDLQEVEKEAFEL